MAATTTARDVTAALRSLWPAPVRLSTVAADPGYFTVTLPATPAASWRDTTGSYRWMEQFLGRRLGAQVTIRRTRTVRRRDCSRDVEFTVAVNPDPDPRCDSCGHHASAECRDFCC